MVNLGPLAKAPIRGYRGKPFALVPQLRVLGPATSIVYAVLETLVTILLLVPTLIATGAVFGRRRRPLPATAAPAVPRLIARPVFLGGAFLSSWIAAYGLLQRDAVLFFGTALLAGVFLHASFVRPHPAAPRRLAIRVARPMVSLLAISVLAAGALGAYGHQAYQDRSQLDVALIPDGDAREGPLHVRLAADDKASVSVIVWDPVNVSIPVALLKSTHEIRVTVDGGPTSVFKVVGQPEPLRLLVSRQGVST